VKDVVRVCLQGGKRKEMRTKGPGKHGEIGTKTNEAWKVYQKTGKGEKKKVAEGKRKQWLGKNDNWKRMGNWAGSMKHKEKKGGRDGTWESQENDKGGREKGGG